MEKRSEQKKQQELLATTQKHLCYKGTVIRVCQEALQWETGENTTFDVVEHPGSVAILPFNDQGELLLIQQWRRVPGKLLLEIPAGLREPEEQPIDSALRELREETGFSCRSLTSLGGFYTSPGFCDEYVHIFLAKDLFSLPLQGEDSDHLDLVPLTKQALFQAISRGEIVDGKTLGALYLYTQGYLSCENMD